MDCSKAIIPNSFHETSFHFSATQDFDPKPFIYIKTSHVIQFLTILTNIVMKYRICFFYPFCHFWCNFYSSPMFFCIFYHRDGYMSYFIFTVVGLICHFPPIFAKQVCSMYVIWVEMIILKIDCTGSWSSLWPAASLPPPLLPGFRDNPQVRSLEQKTKEKNEACFSLWVGASAEKTLCFIFGCGLFRRVSISRTYPV